MNVARAVQWSLLGEFASRTISPLVLIVLARLLSPEDYGVVTAAVLVISFSQVFWEAGVAKALVQFQGDRIAAANVGFWINVVLGLGVALVLVLAAGPIADRVFHDMRVAPVLRLLSAQVVLSSLVSVHAALLQKDMQFKKLFFVRVVTTAAPAFLSIPLALMGMGFWALVWGTLLGQVSQVLLLWYMTDWRPAWKFDHGLARRIAGFSTWVVISGLAGWFYLWADSLIVGMHLGAHDMGLYRTGNSLVIMLVSSLISPALPVLYSHISRVGGSPMDVARILRDVVQLIALVTIPGAFLIFGLAQSIGDVAFGQAWHGIGDVIAVMALTHGFAWIVGANGEAYRAIGHPKYEAMVMLGPLPVYCIAYWFGASAGLAVFLWVRFATAAFGIAVQMWLARTVLAFPVGESLRHVAKVSLVCTPILLIGTVREELGAGWLTTAGYTMIVVAIVICVLWWLERNRLVKMILRLLGRGARIG